MDAQYFSEIQDGNTQANYCDFFFQKPSKIKIYPSQWGTYLQQERKH